jgi:stage II sporulation protein AA (anti-sigma F factor antagonist)
MEWFFRVVQEPRRLFSRYARDARCFGGAIVQQLWQLHWCHRRPSESEAASIDLAEPTWKRLRPPEDLSQAAIERDKLIWGSALGYHCLMELSHVRSIDSSGIGLLIELQRQLLKQDCYLILLAPSEPVVDAIRFMSLTHLFLVASDTVEARELIGARLQQRMRIPVLSSHATLPLIWKGEITAANVDPFWVVVQAQLDSFADYSEPIPIDLSGVGFIDSTGVGLLLRARNYAASKGAQLQFLNPSPAVRNVLRICRLESLLMGTESLTKPKLVQETLQTLNQFRTQWSSLRQRKAT